MSNPVIKQIEQKEHKVSNEKINELRDALDHAERGVCLATTAVYLFTDTEMYHNMGRTLQVGLYESASELEQRFKRLENAITALTDSKETE